MTAFRPSRWRFVAGSLIGALCLVWLFHGVALAPFLQSVNRLRWPWIWAAIGVQLVSYACQGYRWKLLLRPIGDVPWRTSTRAIFAGLFTNEIMPARPGEVLRAYLIARGLHVRPAAALPSIVVERVFDGFWLGLALGITIMLIPLPRELLRVGDALGALVLAAIGVFVVLAFRKPGGGPADTDAPLEPGLRSRTRMVVTRVADGLRDSVLSQDGGVAFGFSGLFLFFQVLAFWLVMQGDGVPLGFLPGLATVVVIQLGTAVPGAPGNVGTYQLACVAGLVLFGIDKTTATMFSMIVFVLLSVPLWIVGALAIAGSGATWTETWGNSAPRRQLALTRTGDPHRRVGENLPDHRW
jgi:uncharacterized membrane protein YbhN (UPF0104 family)